ncbi:MAG: hypothetical protein ACM335_00275 [Deltaproteobacteria bacterium]
MNDSLPIETRIRKLVEDFFASRITGDEFRLGFATMREEFGPRDNEKRKARRKRTPKRILVPRGESGRPVHPLH